MVERIDGQYQHTVERENPQEVPVDRYRAEIIECVQSNPSSIIIGETGSGKTTRTPDFLLASFPDDKIAVTQPRRVAARSVARYVANCRGEKVGSQVGYQVRFEDETTEGTRANFMTDGILLRKLQFDPLLEEYDIVMVDEAHERSLNIDFVLGLLKHVQSERKKKGIKDLKVIVTSATIEKEKFAHYFGQAPIVEVPGRMYPVDVHYTQEKVRDYPKAAAQRVKEIVTSSKQGDVLIFMPGEEEIRRTMKEIEILNLSGIEIMPLFGAISPEDQDRVFLKNPKRKVIVSTNIAETSITIDGVCFVIDSGLIKQKEFDPQTGIEALVTENHAKSGCEQRKGRAGRTAPGTCFRLYSEDDYAKRKSYQTPEIARSNIDHVILTMKKIGIHDIRNFDFIDPPKEEAIALAIDTLKMLGALDADENLTEVGKKMSELPLRPEIARMVIESEKYGCTGKICTIAAMMGEKSIFVRPKGKEHEADDAHTQFTESGSDFLKLLKVWEEWSASGFNEEWARKRYLNVRQLFEVREVRSQLMRELKRQKVVVDDANGNDTVAIQKCIASGMIHNLLMDSGRHSYKRIISDNDSEYVFIHPSSAAFFRAPQFIIGANVVQTSKTFARLCQSVDPKWLPEIAPQLLQEKGKSFRYDAGSDLVIEDVSYSLRGRSNTITTQERTVTDNRIATEQFVRALSDRQVDLPSVKHNTDIVSALLALHNRSGGAVDVPDLGAWYKEKAFGIKSKKDALLIDEKLRIDFGDYCTPDMRSEIDSLYPETIEVYGHTLEVEYEYHSSNVQAYHESERKEKFRATITIPRDIIFKLNPSDLPTLGTSSRPEIVYRFGSGYSSIIDSSLEALKEAVDKKQIENAWYNFNKPKHELDAIDTLQPLPSFESIGAYPVAYTKNYKDEDVFAYPSYSVEQVYDYQTSQYKFQFKVVYRNSKEEAEKSTEQALEIKKQEDNKARIKAEGDVLLMPAREKHTTLDSDMKQLHITHDRYGIDLTDARSYQEHWDHIGDVLKNPDNYDYNLEEVLSFIDEMDEMFVDGREEFKRRIDMIPGVQIRLDELSERLGKITYDTCSRFGISYSQCNDIREKYREASDLLKIEDKYGRPIMPDPEDAIIILDELIKIIPDEENFTPEQEALAEMLSGKNADFAKIIRVRDGQVAEFYSLDTKSNIIQNPTEIPVGASGRIFAVNGSHLVFRYGSGREEGSWNLSDGDYLVGRDASPFLRVEEKEGMPYNLRAIEFVQQTYKKSVQTSHNFVDSQGTVDATQSEKFGTGGFAELLSNAGKEPFKGSGKPSEKEVSGIVTKPMLVEKEKMTEDVRVILMNDLINSRFFLDTVRAVPEPDKKATNADKISKLRIRAGELKRDLNSFEQELTITDDATRARGKVAEIVKKAERVAEEIARLQNSREDWTQRFKIFMEKLHEIAIMQNIVLSDVILDRAKPKIAELAKRKGEITSLDSEIENIMIDLI